MFIKDSVFHANAGAAAISAEEKIKISVLFFLLFLLLFFFDSHLSVMITMLFNQGDIR